MLQLLLSLVSALFAQQAPAVPAAPAAPAAAQVSAPPAYVVGPSDVLGIRVFDEPALTGSFAIDADGTITYPFLQRVPVAGKSLREIEALLSERLAEGYVRRPQVTVDIAQYRSRAIFVLGEVRSPGRYSMEGPVTLLEVIAKAGSFTPTAGSTIIVQRYKEGLTPSAAAPALPGDSRAAEVMRVNVEDLQSGKFAANILLQENDAIFVPQADRFYVTGFVKAPGFFVLKPGMTVQQAIAVAGGLTERGSTRGIKIIRKVDGKEVEIDAKMSDPIRPNDTIRVRQRLI